MANTTTNRFNSAASQDSTYRVLSFDAVTATYSTGTVATYSIAVDARKAKTVCDLGTLTVNGTLNIAASGLTATVSSPSINDELSFWALGGASGTNSVVFGSDFKQQTSNSNTISAAKTFKADFTYNGTNWVGSGFSI